MVTPKINFEIDEFHYNGEEARRIVIFKVPAATKEPTCYSNKPFVRVNSSTTELSQYPEWMRTIYNSQRDWTAEIIEDATIEDLDPEAISLARNGFKESHPQFANDIDSWTDTVFLDRANLTQDGKVTRAAMLLVGKQEKAYKLNHIAQIVWKCYQDGLVFGDTFTIPFMKSTTELLRRIRNYKIKIYPNDSLIPSEVWKYEARSILEGLHNCILHQDYVRNERIIVTEDKEKLTFENAGGFYEGNYEEYIMGLKTPKRYRNTFLAKGMDNVRMIDSKGYGIHNLFVRQKERYLPMPDYNGSDDSHVILHLPGTIIDENYSTLLINNNAINLTEAILLDKVQKRLYVSDEAIAMLRKRKLIEGRKPNIFVAKSVAQQTDKRAEYSKHKGLGDNNCKHLLLESLEEHTKLTRNEIDILLWNVLSDQLSDEQKKSKIGNLLTRLRTEGLICNETKGNISTWSIKK